MHHVHSSFLNSINVVVGLDSRGFLLGPTLSLRLGCSFGEFVLLEHSWPVIVVWFSVISAPIRKRGKLPGEIVSCGFSKEYGKVCYRNSHSYPAGETFRATRRSIHGERTVYLSNTNLRVGCDGLPVDVGVDVAAGVLVMLC